MRCDMRSRGKGAREGGEGGGRTAWGGCTVDTVASRTALMSGFGGRFGRLSIEGLAQRSGCNSSNALECFWQVSREMGRMFPYLWIQGAPML